MIVEQLKNRIAAAMKAKDSVARDVLRLALGEIQTAEARKNAPLGDEEASAALKKLIKSNEETLGLSGEGERADTLRREIAVLKELLPKELTAAEIVAALENERDAIRAAKTDGQATGIAMKALKAAGASVSGTEVGAAVKMLRA